MVQMHRVFFLVPGGHVSYSSKTVQKGGIPGMLTFAISVLFQHVECEAESFRPFAIAFRCPTMECRRCRKMNALGN